MASLHLRNVVLEFLESISIRHGSRRGLEPSKGVSYLRPDRVLTMGEKEREKDFGVCYTAAVR